MNKIDQLITEARNLEQELSESDASGHLLYRMRRAIEALDLVRYVMDAESKREAVGT